MKLFRCLLAVCALVYAAAALPASASARGHLDPSFGDGGVVDLASRPGSEPFARLERARVGSGGETFLLEEHTSCGSSTCSDEIYLRRYTGEGRLDVTFGGGRVTVGTMSRGGPGRLAVDAVGRPVVSFGNEGLVTVRRFRTDGSPDSTFGSEGSTVIRCDCVPDSVEATPDEGVLLLGHSNLERLEALTGTNWFLARLDPNGSLDPGFGNAGIVWRSMKGYLAPALKLAPRSGALLYGFACCINWTKPYLQRMTAEGRFQRRYAAATKRALAGLRDRYSVSGKMAVLPRGRGQVDVIGEANDHGVVVRLRRNGTRDPRRSRRIPWGERRQWDERLHFVDAAADGFGGTFVLVGFVPRRDAAFKVVRLRPGGRLDRSFGAVPLPGAYDERGLKIFSNGPGAAIVFSAGRGECRGGCTPQPKLYGVVGVGG